MFEEYKDFVLISGLAFLQAAFSIYVKAQAQVYIWGRMLEKVETNPRRNLLALISIIIFTFGYLYSIDTENVVFLFIWKFLDWFSMSIMIYVLVGFKLFSRLDTLQDLKIAEDKPEKVKRKK